MTQKGNYCHKVVFFKDGDVGYNKKSKSFHFLFYPNVHINLNSSEGMFKP